MTFDDFDCYLVNLLLMVVVGIELVFLSAFFMKNVIISTIILASGFGVLGYVIYSAPGSHI